MHGLVYDFPSLLVLDNMHPEHLCMLCHGLPPLITRLLVQEEEEVRPASPKYDERSFFYTTPAAFKPAALSGRPQTQWATEGTFLGPALRAAHQSNPTTSSQAAELQQQQQQQQSEHVQNPSRKKSAAGIHDVLRDSREHPTCLWSHCSSHDSYSPHRHGTRQQHRNVPVCETCKQHEPTLTVIKLWQGVPLCEKWEQGPCL